MKIQDEFLGEKEFKIIQNIMLGGSFTWGYSSVIDYSDDKDRYQFCHHFYNKGIPISNYVDMLNPLLEKINAFQIQRIKSNLLTRTTDITPNSYHVDIGDLEEQEEKLRQWTTAIYYVNTNNGYTEFEDGTKVESVANRFVAFPANMMHRGTSCTDEKIRVLINFNFFV